MIFSVNIKMLVLFKHAIVILPFITNIQRPSRWSSYGGYIYNYLCNQGILPLKLWVQIPLRRGMLDATLYDKVNQWLPTTLVSSSNKTDRHDITEVVLKVALNNTTLTLTLHNIHAEIIISSELVKCVTHNQNTLEP